MFRHLLAFTRQSPGHRPNKLGQTPNLSLTITLCLCVASHSWEEIRNRKWRNVLKDLREWRGAYRLLEASFLELGIEMGITPGARRQSLDGMSLKVPMKAQHLGSSVRAELFRCYGGYRHVNTTLGNLMEGWGVLKGMVHSLLIFSPDFCSSLIALYRF